MLRKTPITAVQVCHKACPFPFYISSGEDVDKAIFMDAPIICLTHSSLNEIVIVSSDNGYHPLAAKLRELGKSVLGIGERAKSSSIWTEACNEFCCIEDLPSATDKKEETAAESNREAAESGEDAQAPSITDNIDAEKVTDGTEGTKAVRDEKDKDDSPYTEGIVDNVIRGNVYCSGISYGFIMTEGGEEYFFHRDDIMWHEPRRGDRVRFIVKEPYDEKANSLKERRGRANCVETLDENGKPIGVDRVEAERERRRRFFAEYPREKEGV